MRTKCKGCKKMLRYPEHNTTGCCSKCYNIIRPKTTNADNTNNQRVNTEESGYTSPSPPLRRQDEPAEDGCSGNSPTPVDTHIINFANNAIKAAVTPLPEKILGAESVQEASHE